MRVLRCPQTRLRHSLCLALGVFDGVHRGHREVICRAVKLAASSPSRSAVLTFDPHPEAILGPHGAPPQLTTTEEKLSLLRELGVGMVLIACFDEAMARLPAEEFVEDLLVARLRARHLVVGEKWRFGAGGRGRPQLLRSLGKKMGFEVTVVPALSVGSEKISSTRIRRLLVEGRVAAANDLLGRRYSLEGKVVAGDGIGRRLGFPTANLDLPPEKLLPADGIYACLAGKRRMRPAVAYIGRRPTFDGEGRRVEVHLLESPGRVDLRGGKLRAEFVERLRGDRRFDGERQLVAQMERDCADARVVLEALHS